MSFYARAPPSARDMDGELSYAGVPQNLRLVLLRISRLTTESTWFAPNRILGRMTRVVSRLLISSQSGKPDREPHTKGAGQTPQLKLSAAVASCANPRVSVSFISSNKSRVRVVSSSDSQQEAVDRCSFGVCW